MPGKFEGEPAYAKHFYDESMEGGADENVIDSGGAQIDIFRISSEDTDQFPDLINDEFVILWETNDGFVMTETATSEGDLLDALEDMGVDSEQINDMSL